MTVAVAQARCQLARMQQTFCRTFNCRERPAVHARQALRARPGRRHARGAPQVVAVRVENEEVSLGTVAPDFVVSKGLDPPVAAVLLRAQPNGAAARACPPACSCWSR